jgi:uncharacterized lipoprotein YajG
LQRRKPRTRHAELITALAAAVCLAGCGSGPTPRAAPPPTLPAAVAAPLAARSDEVAQTLAAGDACQAASLAQQLQQETLASINAGRVPAPFQEHLASAANDLVSRIRCIPPAQPHDRGKHKGHEKKKKQNDEND